MYPERFKFELYNYGDIVVFNKCEESELMNFISECYQQVYQKLLDLKHNPRLEVSPALEVMLTSMSKEALVDLGAILANIKIKEDELLQSKEEQ